MKEKLLAMILFFTNKKSINRTALNKLLFFADVMSYINFNSKISEEKYLKKPFGPVPENIDFARQKLLELEALQENIYVKNRYKEYVYTASKINYENLEKYFKENELECLKKVKKNLSEMTATFLSDKSHQYEPWRSAFWDDILKFEKIKEDDSFLNWIKKDYNCCV